MNLSMADSSNGNGHYHQGLVSGKCSVEVCANEKLVAQQAAEIECLRKQLNLLKRERDGILCEVHHLRMEILAAELGRLDATLETTTNAGAGGDQEDDDTLAEDDNPRDKNNDDEQEDNASLVGSTDNLCNLDEDDPKLRYLIVHGHIFLGVSSLVKKLPTLY